MVSECRIIKMMCFATVSEYGRATATRFTRICEGEVAKVSHSARNRGGKASEACRLAMVSEGELIKVTCFATTSLGLSLIHI